MTFDPMTARLRSFSAGGPCLDRGPLLRSTAKFFVVVERNGNERRIAKDPNGFNHLVPCRSCRDHPQTYYPNGYEG